VVEVRDQWCRGELEAGYEADVAAKSGPNCVPYCCPDGLPAVDSASARSCSRYWTAGSDVQGRDLARPCV